MSMLSNRKIVLGVGGGIAAYKSAELVRLLGKAGAEVHVVLSEGGARFVTPVTYQALSGNPVWSDLWDARMPNHMAHTVSVIDPATLKVVNTFKVGLYPQHVVPSWDLKTLYVANNAENSDKGSLTEIDPKTGKPGKTIAVDDPYNMYWTPDGMPLGVQFVAGLNGEATLLQLASHLEQARPWAHRRLPTAT